MYCEQTSDGRNGTGVPVGDIAIETCLVKQPREVRHLSGEDGMRRLCCTNPVRDSSRESSVVAGRHEQTHTPRLQDKELAGL